MTHFERIGFDPPLGAFGLDPLVLNTKISGDNERIVLCNFTIKVVRIVTISIVVIRPLINRLVAIVVVCRPGSCDMLTIVGVYDGSIIHVESASSDGDILDVTEEGLFSGHRAPQSP